MVLQILGLLALALVPVPVPVLVLVLVLRPAQAHRDVEV